MRWERLGVGGPRDPEEETHFTGEKSIACNTATATGTKETEARAHTWAPPSPASGGPSRSAPTAPSSSPGSEPYPGAAPTLKQRPGLPWPVAHRFRQRSGIPAPVSTLAHPQMPPVMTSSERRDLLDGFKRPAVCIFGIHQ